MAGESLGLDAYYEDFRSRFRDIEERDCWKLERGQSFREKDSPSWEAFVKGDWNQALRLISERRESLTEYYGRAAGNGVHLYRVRVVAEPISAYLQWELNSLLQRSECGERIRVVGLDDVAGFERNGELPEIVTLGTKAVYQVVYSRTGLAEGAVRSLKADDVDRWYELISSLYENGEEIAEFVERKGVSLRQSSA
ncbi:hypothetical protein CFP75_36290 [Amycolatopsis alba DSM 44262]|uniref:DUF6879 domain-containing protein n=1 Tax=Amycolatopsis alba DSM 44262 TaxID=1125972 RepID=A0A229RBS9_AMYAL|nr:hypothetical protein CFP75_36290 [Amycolatopsis alba DSM 44262]